MKAVFGMCFVAIICLSSLYLFTAFEEPSVTNLSAEPLKKAIQAEPSLPIETSVQNKKSLKAALHLVPIKALADGRLDKFNFDLWTSFLNEFNRYDKLTGNKQELMLQNFILLTKDLEEYIARYKHVINYERTVKRRQHFAFNFSHVLNDLISVYQCSTQQYSHHAGCKLLNTFYQIAPLITETNKNNLQQILPYLNSNIELLFTFELAKLSTFPRHLNINPLPHNILLTHFNTLTQLNINNYVKLASLSYEACDVLSNKPAEAERDTLVNAMFELANQLEARVSTKQPLKKNKQIKVLSEYDNAVNDEQYKQTDHLIKKIKTIHALYSNNIAQSKRALSELLALNTQLKDYTETYHSYLPCINKKAQNESLINAHNQYLINTFSYLESQNKPDIYRLGIMLGDFFEYNSAKEDNLLPTLQYLEQLKSESTQEAHLQAYIWLQITLANHQGDHNNIYLAQLDYQLAKKHFSIYELIRIPGDRDQYNHVLIEQFLALPEETLMQCPKCFISLLKSQNSNQPLTENTIARYKKIDKTSIDSLFHRAFNYGNINHAEALLPHLDKAQYTKQKLINYQIKFDVFNQRSQKTIKGIEHYLNEYGLDEAISRTIKYIRYEIEQDLKNYNRRTGESLKALPEQVKAEKQALLEKLKSYAVKDNIRTYIH